MAAAVQLNAKLDCLTIQYRYSKGQDEPEVVAETVKLARCPCRYGGQRLYFVCPGVNEGRPCGRRVVKLYGGGRLFLCRHCHGLEYGSRFEGAWHRSLRRANRVRQRLGGHPGLDQPFPPRPRRMWRKTYERLETKALEAEMRSDQLLWSRAQRLEAQLKKKDRS
jgi:hypothetical protein